MIFNCVSSLVSLLSFHLLRLCSFLSLCMNALHYAWNFVRMYDGVLNWFQCCFNSSCRKLNEFHELPKERCFKMNEIRGFWKPYVYRIPRWISHRAPIDGLFPARDCLVQLACLCSRFEWGHLFLLETRRGHKYHLQDLKSQWIVRQWQPKVVLSTRRTEKEKCLQFDELFTQCKILIWLVSFCLM